MNRRAMLSLVVLLASLIAVACGGGNPAGPEGSGSVTIQGVVLGSGSSSSTLTASSNDRVSANNQNNQKVKVTVAGTTINAEVGANGTFQLTGVPSGSFVLVFTADGVEIGRVEITASEGSEVKITVQVENSKVVVVDLKVDDKDANDTTTKTCIIEGGKVGSGIELEGDVSSGTSSAFKMTVNGNRGSAPVDVSASAASFKCNGFKGTDTECKALLKGGVKVHVRGTLMTCTTSAAQVTASEVKIQKD